jgi:DNA-binding response OmpR family regulator
MKRQGRILIVDDEDVWRNELGETLQREGFLVDFASTTAEALECLQKCLYHLLVLDIRLVDVAGNKEGLDLLGELEKRGLNEATKVIMLSGYGTPEYMRTSFREYKVVDFLSKDDFDDEEFLQEVRQVFSEKVKINLALEIHWQPHGSGPEQVVLDLNINRTLVKYDTPLQSQIASELDDLLCRLFRHAASILVRPLTAGQSGTRVLRVQPFYTTGGGGSEVVVKFGDFRKIEQEYHKFKEYVQPFIGGTRNTTVLDLRRTPHLGGIIYSLLGSSHDQLVDFGEFYRRADVSQVKDALQRLFWDTCGAWYANRGNLQPLDLAADYQRLLEYKSGRLEQIVAEQLKLVELVESEKGKQRLVFNHLRDRHTYTNPLQVMDGLSFKLSTYTCITHGDFNHHNLLVDSNGNMWMIDFQGTGLSHILRDIAILDSAIRFQLLTANEATLKERLQMEKALCSIERFSEVEQLANKLPTTNRPLAKTYAAVVHLRTLARRLVEQNPGDDISEYYIALFYTALYTLRFTQLSQGQREHALLCASLLADRLGLSS